MICRCILFNSLNRKYIIQIPLFVALYIINKVAEGSCAIVRSRLLVSDIQAIPEQKEIEYFESLKAADALSLSNESNEIDSNSVLSDVT